MVRDGTAEVSGLQVQVDGAKVTHVSRWMDSSESQHWGQDSAGRWAGLLRSGTEAANESVDSYSPWALMMIGFRALTVATAAGLCLLFSARFAWVAVVFVAAISLFETGVQSAVVRGFWSPVFSSVVPSVVVLVSLAWLVLERRNGPANRC